MWELDQQCFEPGISYSRSELRAFLSRKTAETIVAERQGHVVAFVLGLRRGPTEGHVITLDVATSARRQGVGRRLLAEVANTSAIAFYERLGYRKVARLAGYYGPRLHAWAMEKALTGLFDSVP
jgi:ribosomal-protein-alanine N-acetyltransferase